MYNVYNMQTYAYDVRILILIVYFNINLIYHNKLKFISIYLFWDSAHKKFKLVHNIK